MTTVNPEELFGDAKPREDFSYLGEGNHLLVLGPIVQKKTRKSGLSVIVEFYVSESDKAPKGSKQSITFRIGLQDAEQRGYEQSDLLTFFKAVSDQPDDQLREWGSDALGPDQPALGLYVKAYSKNITTKKGATITKHTWEHVKDQGDIKGRRKSIEATMAPPAPPAGIAGL